MAAAFVVIVAGMRAAAVIVNPLLLAVFLSVVSAPAYFALLRRGVANWLSLVIVIGVLSIVVVSVVFVVMESIAGFTARHKYYRDLLNERTAVFQSRIDEMIPDWAPFGESGGQDPSQEEEQGQNQDSGEPQSEDSVQLKSDDSAARTEVESDSEVNDASDVTPSTDDSTADEESGAARPVALEDSGAPPTEAPPVEVNSQGDDDAIESATDTEPIRASIAPADATEGGEESAEDGNSKPEATSASTSQTTSSNPHHGFRFESTDQNLPTTQQEWRDLLSEQFNPGTLISLAASVAGSIGHLLSNTFLILLAVIFILLETGTFTSKMKDAFTHTDEAAARGKEIIESIHDYIVIKTGVSLATGLLIALWLRILGVPYAGLWGLLAFLFNFIPNIGSFIAAIPAVLIAWLELTTVPAMAAAAGFVFVNAVIGNFIEPRLMGRGLGLSPLVVFCSMVFWGWVLGPVGMLLSVPLTMTLRIALEGFDDTKWIATLMGNAG